MTYYLFEKDTLHPAVFLHLFFTAGIIIGFYLYNYWHLYEYMSKTVQIILLGLVSFTVGSFIAKANKTRYKISNLNTYFFKRIDLNRIDIRPIIRYAL